MTEAFKHLIKPKLQNSIILYLRHTAGKDSETDKFLFNNVLHQINEMVNAGVVSHIIYSYILTVAQVVKIQGYDLVLNYYKIYKLLNTLFQDDIVCKKYTDQTIAYCIQSNSKYENTQDPALKAFLDKYKC